MPRAGAAARRGVGVRNRLPGIQQPSFLSVLSTLAGLSGGENPAAIVERRRQVALLIHRFV